MIVTTINLNGIRAAIKQRSPENLGLLPWLAENATPMLTVDGPTNGVTTLWHIDQEALDSGAAAQVAYPRNEREQ